MNSSSPPVFLMRFAAAVLAVGMAACAGSGQVRGDTAASASVGDVAPTYDPVGRPYAADASETEPATPARTQDRTATVGRPYAADASDTGSATHAAAQDPQPTATVGRPYAADASDTEPATHAGTQDRAATVGRPYAADTSDTEPATPTGTRDPQPTATVGRPYEADADATGPTQAELDYAAIYGEEVYDPLADPSLPPPAQMPPSYDPWEPFNRRVHRFNNAIDRNVALPLARAYVNAVPRPVRLGVSNFFSNLGQPVSAVNALLQGKPKQAAQSLGRFVLNFTLGIGGIFDPASDAKIPHRSEDFGQTLGVWGWESSRYLELPLFGPRTLRDAFGLVGDAPLSPTRQLDDDAARIGLQGLQLVDIRTQLMAVDRMREGAADEYALVRDAWLQRRNYQIHGDRAQADDDYLLPDYLLDDEANPTVPADAMPVPIPDM